MISSLMHQPWYKVVTGHGAAGRFGCVHLGHFDHRIIASTPGGEVGIMLDGWLFGVGRNPRRTNAAEAATDAAALCLELYLEQGPEFAHNLNGQFNMLVWDDRRGREVFLINDRYGLRPWQYMSLNGALYFAPEGKAIFAGSGQVAKLNERMIVNQLSWGRIWIGQETLFENIKMLPPASLLRWCDGKISLDQYWDYVYEPATIDEEFIDHTVATFRQAVMRQTRAPVRYGVSLSGGLDSRALLAALAQKDGSAPRAYSWGVSDAHDEVSIARQTAAELGVPWKYIPLSPADFISQAELGAFMTEGLDLVVQSYGLKVYPAIRAETNVAITGLGLDLTLGGSYLTESVAGNESDASQAFATVLNQASLFSRQECLKLTHLKSAVGILEQLHQQAVTEWSAGQNSHPADNSDRFVLRSRVARFIFMRQVWQRFFVEDVAPTFDNEFIDCLLRIPPAWRVGHRFYQRFLEKLNPGMMHIPYQRTLLPPAAPLHFWPVGARLEEQREELYRQLWRDTNGQVFVPYTRFSTNYDEWLRRDPDWLRMTNELLLGPDSLSCEKFLNREAVTRLIDDHRSGRSANHKKIIPLLTLETFLRQFFGGDSPGEQQSELLSVSA